MSQASFIKTTILGAISISILMLSGCHSAAFRNRTYDYTRTTVSTVPALTMPANIAAPVGNQTLHIPDGQTSYAPSAKPNITPPGFNQTYQINDKAKQATLVSSSS